MKKILLSLLLVLLATVNAFAVDYFVRPGGSHTNDGLSWATAFKNPNNATSVLRDGDRVIMGRGVYDTVQIIPYGGGAYSSQTAWICSTAYVNGSDAGRNDTYIRGSVQVSLTWTQVGSTNIWTTTFDSPQIGVGAREYIALFRNDVQCWPRMGVSAVTNGTDTSQTGCDENNEYAYNTSTNVISLYATTNPNSETYRVSWRPVMALQTKDQSNILIYGLTIEEASTKMLIIGDWDTSPPKPGTVTISHCNLRKSTAVEQASNGSIIYSGNSNYPSAISEWSQFSSVIGCSLSQVKTVNGAYDVHGGAGIEFYFTRDGLIDSNVFFDLTEGVALKMGCYADNGVKSLNWNIRFNRFSGMRREALWIGNKVGNLDFLGNIVENCPVGIDIHTSNPCGLDPTQGALAVQNNTFFNNDNNFNASAANSIGGNTIKYNIFADTSGNVGTNYVFTIGFRLMGGEAPQETPATETYWLGGVDNNMYYYANGQTFMGWYSGNSGFTPTQPNFTQWQQHFDANSISGINPNFNSSHTGDYSRPSSNAEINVSYDGYTWTRYGAWQSGGGGCTPLSAPTLSTPADGATGQTTPLTFDWSDIVGATNYRIEIDNVSNFASPDISAQSGTSTYSTSSLANGATYYWRAAGYDACGWGTWSATRSFTMSCPALSAPTLSSPSDGAASIQQPITFDWSDVTGIIDYQIQIDNNSDYSSTAVDQVVVPSTLSVNGLSEGTTYYWRVRSRDGCSYSSWTTSRTFSTYVPASGIDSIIAVVSLSANDVMHYYTNGATASQLFDIAGNTLWAGNAGPERNTIYTNYTLNVAQNAPMDSLFAYFYCYSSNSTTPCNVIIKAFKANNSPVFIDGASGITDVTARTKTTASITWTIPAVTAGNWYRTPNLITLFDEVNALYAIEAFGLQIADDGVNGGGALRPFYSTDIGSNDPRLHAYLTANSPPTTPSLVSPSNGVTINLSKPTFTWTNSTDVEGNTKTYNIDIATDNGFSNIVSTITGLAEGTTTTSWQVTNSLATGTTYYWRVRANDGLLFSSYSASRSFTVTIQSKPPLKKKVGKK